ncbi:MAG: glutamate racemase [Bacteroidetes bacterium]|nr:MAG: glutamate racemase [Bacteroidota bacterium]
MINYKQEQAKPIGVFDSGIGGLTVVRALIKRLPHENIVYFGDTARVPYGSKSPQTVREYADEDTAFLIGKNVKMIVIACNTVSSVAIDVVQKRAKIPVVGVIVPGAKAASEATRNNRIGVIGTVGTIKSNAYTNAIRLENATATVTAQACPLFVPLAEEGWIEHKATELIAKEYLFPLKLAKIDTLVLGCTHYPILSETISAVLGGEITLIDSGEATAKEVERLLIEQQLKNASTHKANLQFYVSDIPHKFTEIGERFLGQTLGRVRQATL